jgi:hypothetical protein
MDEVNIALFERDWNNTIYFFALNADEQIYLRYGGRDSKSPDIYLSLDSLALALQKGLDLHRQFQAGQLQRAVPPKPKFPRDIPLLIERTYARYACVECHLIGDFQNLQLEREGKLDRPSHLYRSPDIQTLGIHLDVPKGLQVKTADGMAGEAGMVPGDTIKSIRGTDVWTFGDLQYRLDQVPRDSRQLAFTVRREGKEISLNMTLQPLWWVTDVTFRQSSVEPKVHFESAPLSREEKAQLGLNPAGFASRVTHVDMFAELTKSHLLTPGDIVFAVNGVDQDNVANTADLYIKLYRSPGESLTLGVIRGGRRMQMNLKTYRVSFRK